MRIKISDMTGLITLILHATLEVLRGDMGHGELSNMGFWGFLKSTGDIGTPIKGPLYNSTPC